MRAEMLSAGSGNPARSHAFCTRRDDFAKVTCCFLVSEDSGCPLASCLTSFFMRVEFHLPGLDVAQEAVQAAHTLTLLTVKPGLVTGDGRAHMVVVTHKEQQLASAGEWYTYRNSSVEQANEQTVFFTDRSLYRPGQTVQFKGITIRYHHGTDNYEAVPNRDVSVVFTDPNGKEVARHQARSNDYGSFSGSFTAPRVQDRELLRTDPGKCRAQAYDLVINGSEIASGSIRINRPDLQERVFRAVGFSDEEAEAIALYKEINADVLLLDEHVARRAARREGIRLLGFMGLLVLAKHAGLILSVRDVFAEVKRASGFRVAPAVEAAIFERARE